MTLSFTGTRKGMSFYQKQCFENLILSFGKELACFKHGGAVGADEEAHKIVRKILGKSVAILVFPCPTSLLFEDTDFIASIKPPLIRNKDIVKGTDFLIATPFTDTEVLRSGTWSTIRYARKIGVEQKILAR